MVSHIAWPFRDACVDGRKSLYTIASLSIYLYCGSYNGDSGVKEQLALTEYPRGKEVRARVIESLHTPSQESRDHNSGKVQTV